MSANNMGNFRVQEKRSIYYGPDQLVAYPTKDTAVAVGIGLLAGAGLAMAFVIPHAIYSQPETRAELTAELHSLEGCAKGVTPVSVNAHSVVKAYCGETKLVISTDADGQFIANYPATREALEERIAVAPYSRIGTLDYFVQPWKAFTVNSDPAKDGPDKDRIAFTVGLAVGAAVLSKKISEGVL